MESPKALFELAALKWMCSVLANGLYLDEGSFNEIVGTVNLIGRRMEFDFNFSCLYIEAVEDLLLSCVSHLRKDFVDHWNVSSNSVRRGLSREGYEFGKTGRISGHLYLVSRAQLVDTTGEVIIEGTNKNLWDGSTLDRD